MNTNISRKKLTNLFHTPTLSRERFAEYSTFCYRFRVVWANNYVDGSIANDPTGSKLSKFYKIAELILHCIYSTPEDAPQQEANVCTYGSMKK